MRRNKVLPLFALLGAFACGSDSGTGVPRFTYTLQPAATAVSVGQDSIVPLGVTVTRGTDPITGARLSYASGDYRIATVDSIGRVTGLAGGTTAITVRLGAASIEVPVTVRPHPADGLELTVLSGPAGGLKSVRADTGTFFALPADPATSRLRAVVMVGADTVFCNYCVAKTPARVQRAVRFVSLDTVLAKVNNANNPTLQTSTDTTGRVTPKDTSSAGVRIVMEVPGDSAPGRKWKDTVLVKLALRPLDSLRFRPDSNFFPTTNGTGLQKQIYQNADSAQANVVASSTTNFIAGLDFLSRVQDLPTPAGTGGGVRWIVARVTSPDGDPLVRRPSLPNVVWESANPSYLTVNAAGAVTGLCAFIGGSCPTAGSSVLTCTSTGGRMPAAFGGSGTYSIPSCSPPVTIPMPGAFCTSITTPTVPADLSSTCTVWIRATAIDPATGRQLRSLYRMNIRR